MATLIIAKTTVTTHQNGLVILVKVPIFSGDRGEEDVLFVAAFSSVAAACMGELFPNHIIGLV